MVDAVRSLFAQLGIQGLDWLAILVAYIIIITIILVVASANFMIQVWFERRIVARMQDRLGPNRVGPLGLFQSIADGVKMFTKEDIVPRAADRWIHLLAPVVSLAPVMMIFAVVPWGRNLAPIELNAALLYVVAVSSVAAVGLMMAGWGSNNKFALLGAMRAVAQMVSYEIPAVLALLAMIVIVNVPPLINNAQLEAGTMSLTRFSEQQAGIPFVGTALAGAPDVGLGWFVFTPVGLLGFAIFFISVLAEGERTPFDIPEADSEIVAGYMTEYSGMKFALFYLGQFVLNFVLSMVAATVFLGGWQGPGVAQLAALGGGGEIAASVLSLVYLLLKTWALFFVMIWLRGAFPRLRVDQLMGFAWKFLLPLALINLLSVSLWAVIRLWGSTPAWTLTLAPFGFNLLGWIETLAPWARELLAIVVTGVINVAAYRWLLAANRESDEATASTAQNQTLGVSPLP